MAGFDDRLLAEVQLEVIRHEFDAAQLFLVADAMAAIDVHTLRIRAGVAPGQEQLKTAVSVASVYVNEPGVLLTCTSVSAGACGSDTVSSWIPWALARKPELGIDAEPHIDVLLGARACRHR